MFRRQLLTVSSMIEALKGLSPFLAIVVSIVALSFGPYIAGRVARAQAVAAMREKWIYTFRDCLVELITEFDVLHESVPTEGIRADDEHKLILRQLRILENRVRLMVNAEEPLYKELIESIEATISMLVSGITDYNQFHALNESVKLNAQAAIRSEWKKIA